MNFNSILKKYGIYVLAVAIFVIAALVYCKPALSGKYLNGTDVEHYQAASMESRNFSAATSGKGSWWTSSMFSGMPNYQIGGGAEYKANKLLRPVTRILHKCIVNTVWAVIFYFVCFFILLLAFGVTPWLAILGALTLGLSSYFMTLLPAGHSTKVACIALTTVVVAGYKLIYDGKYILGAVLVMLFVASGYTLHPQMFYYFFMMLGLFCIAELCKAIKEKTVKKLCISTAIFVAAVGIGVGTGCANVFANSEYVKESTRGGSVLDAYNATHPIIPLAPGETLEQRNARMQGPGKALSTQGGQGLDIDYATKFSYSIDETLTLMIPGFKGGSSCARLGKDSKLYKAMIKHNYKPIEAIQSVQSVPVYWGFQPITYGSVYVGAIVCFLFLLGLIIVKGPYKWVLLASTIFSITLAWGCNFMWLTKLFFKFFPLYSKFRAVSSILIIAEVAMPLLGFMALKAILDGTVEVKKLRKAILISAGVTAGICLFFGLFGGMIYDFGSKYDADTFKKYQDWILESVKDERRALLTTDSFRSFFLIVAAAVALYFTTLKTKVKKGVLVGLVALVSVVEIWAVDRRYFNDSHFKTPQKNTESFEITDWEKAIVQDLDPNFRVMNNTVNTYNDSRTSVRLKSIGGYSAAKLSRYNDLIEIHLRKNHLPVFNMLNTKYFVINTPDRGIVSVINPDALGNAWFVSRVKAVDNPRDEMSSLTKVDLATTAVVHDEFADMYKGECIGKGAGANIIQTKFAPNHIEYKSYNPSNGLAVFSEIWYPHGWHCTIDGKPASYFRANYVLRALVIPAGEHKIVFDFDPESVKKGDRIATAFIYLMYGLVALAILYGLFCMVKKLKK